MKTMISRLFALKSEMIKKEDRIIIKKSLNSIKIVKPSDMIMKSFMINNEYFKKQRSFDLKTEGNL